MSWFCNYWCGVMGNSEVIGWDYVAIYRDMRDGVTRDVSEYWIDGVMSSSPDGLQLGEGENDHGDQ